MSKIVFILHVISNLPFWCVAFIVIGINTLIIFPIIFNCFIIPKIEKKVGQKLEFISASYIFVSTYYYLIGGEVLGKYCEIAMYIVIKYLASKFGKKLNNKSRNALQSINYDIKRASRFELVMSFAVFLNIIFAFLLVIIVLLQKK